MRVDNCWRENKNHCVCCYLAWLVERFKGKLVIGLSFFYKGHTHFLPDQIASRVGLCKKHSTILTRVEWWRCVEESYTPRPLYVTCLFICPHLCD